jgi:hypothetical protein
VIDGSTGSSRLGGGYAESSHDPGPTVEAVLAAATAGDACSRLVVLAGPPGVGKTAVGLRVLELLPNSFCVDKDLTAGGFILAAARTAGLDDAEAYGTQRYWQELRPLEYACALSTACANLIGTRIVFAIGGWGPELGVDRLWSGLGQRLLPAELTVLHLDAPGLETWRRRLAARGSRSDSPWFEDFAKAVTSIPVWDGAVRIPTAGPLHEVVANVLACLPGPGSRQTEPLRPETGPGRPEACR